MSRSRGAGAAVTGLALLAALTGCAGGPGRDGSSTTQTGAPAATPSSTAAPTADPGSDVVAPHYEENSAATRRVDPAPRDSSSAASTLPGVRAALDAQRRGGALDVTTTQATVRGLGYADADVEVIDIQEHLGDPAATPGVLVGIATGPRTCVVGTVTQRAVVLEVTGTGPPGEYRCVAPVTH